MKNSAQVLIQELTDYAPLALFIAMLSAFLFMGVLQNQFYHTVFSASLPELAIFLGLGSAIIMQVCRMASGLTSAFHFKNGAFFKGILALAFSVALSWMEHTEAAHMAKMWANDDLSADAYLLILRFVIWTALALEFSLAITVRSPAPTLNENADNADYVKIEALELDENLDKSFSSNGSTSASSNGRKRATK